MFQIKNAMEQFKICSFLNMQLTTTARSLEATAETTTTTTAASVSEDENEEHHEEEEHEEEQVNCKQYCDFN